MNQINPKVTVRISAYNHKKYINQAVESVVNQTYQDFELIVIDDCSTDGTAEILEELEKKYAFNLILNKKNKGLNANNELALRIAKGKYIAGLGSDDFWPGNRLHVQVTAMENNPEFGFSYGKGKQVNNKGIIVGEEMPDGYSGWFFNKLFLSEHSGISATTVMFKTDLLRKANVHDKNMYINDKYMFMKVSKLAPVLYIDEFLTFYRIHDNHYSGNLKKMFEGKLALIDEYRSERNFKIARRNVFLDYLGKASKRKNFNLMKYFTLKSLKYFYRIKFWKAIIRYTVFLIKKNNIRIHKFNR